MTQFATAFLALAMLALTSATALATGPEANDDFGSGEAPRYYERYEDGRDLLDEARAPAMAALGEDALRFSSQPALGGTGYIIVLRPNGSVEVSWFQGHSMLGWRRTRHVRFRTTADEYQDVVADVDDLIAAGIEESRRRGDAIPVCADGAGYLAERIRGGQVSWLRPECGDHQIANYLTAWAFTHLA